MSLESPGRTREDPDGVSVKHSEEPRNYCIKTGKREEELEDSVKEGERGDGT